jgi:DNA-binding NarL/FixJ family response regulator
VWLRAVLDRASALPLAVVVTTRPLRAGTMVHRAMEALTAVRLDLGPLSGSDAVALAAAVLGNEPSAELAAAVARAAGNPLLVLAVLEAFGRAGDVVRVDGQGVALGELNGQTSRTVQVAAVLGTEIDPDVVASVAGVLPSKVLADLEIAVAAGVLVAGDGYAFRHELHRDAVLAGLDPAVRACVHRDAARTLAVDGLPAIVVADHFARGARPGDMDAVAWLHEAALETVAVAPHEALRLCDLAIGVCAGEPPYELLFARVRALAGAGHFSEADVVGRALLQGGLTSATGADVRRELALSAFMQGRVYDAVVELERCAALTDDPAGRARVGGEIALARVLAGDYAAARGAAEDAEAGGRRTGDAAARVAGGAVLCLLDLFAVRIAAATRRATDIVALAEQPDAAEAHVAQPWFVASLLWLEADRFERSASVARKGRDVATERGAAWSVPAYDAVSAFSALRCGALDDAAAAAEATLGYLDGVDGIGVAVWCHGFLAQIALHHGEADLAAEHIATGEASLGAGRASFGFEQLRLAGAALLEQRGDLDDAYTALAEVWDLFTAVGVRSALPAFGVPLVRLAAQTQRVERCSEVAAELADIAAASRVGSSKVVAELAAAWRDGDPDRALTAADSAAGTLRRPLAAAAFTDAASLLRRRGRACEANHVAERAARLWTTMGAEADARACALASRTGRQPAGRPRFGVAALTGTERRIVAMVANGLANAEIAAQVGVSRRTVESHVSAAYRKLEVTSRVALANAAIAHNL